MPKTRKTTKNGVPPLPPKYTKLTPKLTRTHFRTRAHNCTQLHPKFNQFTINSQSIQKKIQKQKRKNKKQKQKTKIQKKKTKKEKKFKENQKKSKKTKKNQ